jgi:hypothetical protein
MMQRLWTAILLAALATGLLTVIACDNESTIEAQVSPQTPKGAAKVKVHVLKNKQSGTFNFDGQTVSISCEVTLTGVVDGQPFVKTVSAKLTSTGAKGAKYEMDCTDPLLLQFPADANNFVATYTSDTGISGRLTVQSRFLSIATAPGQSLQAEPGQQLVLISFPDSMPDGDGDLSLTFDLSSIRSIQVKPVITGKVLCDTKTYYPPIAPATTSMSSVPALTIPVSSVLAPIPLPLDTVSDSVNVDISCQ